MRAAARSLLPFAALLVLGGWSFFDPFHAAVETGNHEAEAERAPEALGQYEEAARLSPSSPIPDFNRGIVLARDGQPDPAQEAFLAAAATADPAVAGASLYNLGNVLLEQQDAKGAVEAYLGSLDLLPDDADARGNLELALQLLQQQQQQQQEQQQDREQEPQDSPEGEQEQQQQPPDDEEDSQNESPQADEGEEEPPEPQEQPAPEDRLTAEDAERLLNAIESDELKVLQQLNEQEEETQGAVRNDW